MNHIKRLIFYTVLFYFCNELITLYNLSIEAKSFFKVTGSIATLGLILSSISYKAMDSLNQIIKVEGLKVESVKRLSTKITQKIAILKIRIYSGFGISTLLGIITIVSYLMGDNTLPNLLISTSIVLFILLIWLDLNTLIEYNNVQDLERELYMLSQKMQKKKELLTSKDNL
jgi:hypothetical protein